MPMFAYSGDWYPSWNPFGVWSLGAALIAAAAWFLGERRFLPSERSHGWLMLLAPLFLLGFVFHSKVRLDPLEPLSFRYAWPRFRFPDAQDYIADYIFVAVALLLSWKVTRLRFRDFRVIGFIECGLALTFLVLESVFLYQRFYVG